MPFQFRYVPAERPLSPALLLLHGTGGDENDLIPLGQLLARGGALLSPRGQVSENGMNRFFRRFAEGRFDHADVRARADDLAGFIAHNRAEFGLSAPIALGYSNGANIAAALLHRAPQALSGAILLRAMLPLPEAPEAALGGLPVLMLTGGEDPIVPRANSEALAARLAEAGAEVTHHVLAAGHQLTDEDLALARLWLDRFHAEV